jgi:hypothetical protein
VRFHDAYAAIHDGLERRDLRVVAHHNGNGTFIDVSSPRNIHLLGSVVTDRELGISQRFQKHGDLPRSRKDWFMASRPEDPARSVPEHPLDSAVAEILPHTPPGLPAKYGWLKNLSRNEQVILGAAWFAIIQGGGRLLQASGHKTDPALLEWTSFGAAGAAFVLGRLHGCALVFRLIVFQTLHLCRLMDKQTHARLKNAVVKAYENRL